MKAVLTYHSIDESGSPISISRETFERHMKWLRSGRVAVVPLDALDARSEEGNDAVAIAFDDGFVSARDGLERMRRDGLPVTVFTVTRRAGETNQWLGVTDPGIPVLPLLGWDDLERLVNAGVRVEAHTRTHPHLTRLSAMQVEEELLGSRADLQERLGMESRQFAYPYGDLDAGVADRARGCFERAYTTEFRALRGDDDTARLPRLDMYYFQQPGLIESWGTPRFARYVAWCRTRRRVRALLFR